MRIIKKLNNSAAVAVDDNGKELVVFGRGLGFGKLPYTLKDLSKIERSFYDVKLDQRQAIADLPQDLILLAADVAESAAFALNCPLSPNLTFTLADHLMFAIQRAEKNTTLNTPLAYELSHLYPDEVSLAENAIELVRQRRGISLPEEEKYHIALHIITAEQENGDISSTLQTTQIIADVTRIIESQFGLQFSRKNFNYSRFVTHLQFLILRLEQRKQEDSGMSVALRQIRSEYPQAYFCTEQVAEYFQKKWGWDCNEDEKLYLLMHIQRMKERHTQT